MDKLAEETRQLVRLQAVELERTRLTSALKALPGEIALAENLLATARKRVTEAETGLKREELLRASLELEVSSHRSKAARHRSQMDTARNAAQASALEHEITFAETEITRLEDNELASMEKTEHLESELAKARELAAKLTETVGLIRARVGEQDLEFREQLTSLKAERDALRTEIPSDTLAHFDRIATSRGTGLARAESQQCSGCRMGIRPQVWNQLRDGAVLPCESCSRILYFDPALEPAPAPAKIARSIPTDLGGSSIKRKQAGV
jgi:predicted  nucleic acid-binding Zn-ribbon protein